MNWGYKDMNLLNMFKRKQTTTKTDMQAIRARVARSQEQVYKAVGEINHPVNGLAIARYMHVDSASITPRLAELTRKGKLRVAFTKHGLDGRIRKFYVVAR
jgi:hypothetical protein